MQNILIIGGSSGVGLSLVERLKNRFNIISTYNNNPITSIKNVTYQHYNVLTSDVEELNVPESLNGIVYCPGSINLKPFNRYSEKELLDDIKINVIGFLKILSSYKNKLLNGENPSVVLFSSVAATKGIPFHTQVAFSKGAIESVAKTLAAELAPKIRVNVVAPSLLETPLSAKFLNTETKVENNIKRHPLKKIGEPSDISSVVDFLLSENAKWMTGQIIHVDGGISTLSN